jgi:hypothetical protein
VVAHEIQQPLSTILLQCQLALRDLERADGLQPPLARRLAAMSSEAQRAVTITERKRMLLRNVKSPHSPLNLVTVVESCLLFCKRAIRQHAIALSTEGLEGELLLSGDATQLQSAINNLIQNAIDALALQEQPRQRRLHLALKREANLGAAEHRRQRCRLPGATPGHSPHHLQSAWHGPWAVRGSHHHAAPWRQPQLRPQRRSGRSRGGDDPALLSRGDRYEPALTLRNTRQLLEDSRVLALFGYVGTLTSKVVLPLVEREGIPFMAPLSGAQLLRAALFHLRAGYQAEIDRLVDALVRDAHHRIAVVAQNDAFGDDGQAVRPWCAGWNRSGGSA